MRSTALLTVTLQFFLVSCASGPSSATGDPVRDAAKIQEVLTTWYAAMHVRDSIGTVAPLTDDFYLLEDTLPLDRDQLAARILGGRGSGSTFTSTRTDFRTRVHGGVAWTTFHNHETSHSDKTGENCSATFLETVVFVRERSHWLIDRYHAAALSPWSC